MRSLSLIMTLSGVQIPQALPNKENSMKENEFWHPDKDGTWTHFAQRTKNNIRTYYTDGKEVLKRKVSDTGHVIGAVEEV